MVHIDEFNDLYDFLKKNHPTLYEEVEDLPSPDCLQPIVICDDENVNNTDKSVDPSVEEKVEVKYFFPNHGTPRGNTAHFDDEKEYARALFQRNTPELLFFPGDVINDHDVALERLCPIQFPYGHGGLNEKRKTHVSTKDILRHYGRIAKRNLHRQEFTLIRYNAWLRLSIFQSGIIYSRSLYKEKALVDQVAKITKKDLEEACKKRDLMESTRNDQNVSQLQLVYFIHFKYCI